MDGQRFDNMTKKLVKASASRRGMLRGVVGGTLAAVVGNVALMRAAAQPVSIQASDLICEDERLLCNRSGEPAGRCGENCRCARAVNGDRKCVDLGNATCKNRTRCDSNRECAKGEVCIDVRDCNDEECDKGRKPGRCFDKCAS